MKRILLCLLAFIELAGAGQMDIDLGAASGHNAKNDAKAKKAASAKMTQKELEALDDDDLLDSTSDSLNSGAGPASPGDSPYERSGVYAGAKVGMATKAISIARTPSAEASAASEKKTQKDGKALLAFKKHSPDLSLYLGYVHAMSALRLGAELNVDFLPDSKIDVKDNDDNGAAVEVAPGTEYSLDGKVGVALGVFEFYGKLGVNLSRWKYNWLANQQSDVKKSFMAGAQWGAGVQWNVWDHVSVQLEFRRNFKQSVDKLNVSQEQYKYNDAKLKNTKYTLGVAYKF